MGTAPKDFLYVYYAARDNGSCAIMQQIIEFITNHYLLSAVWLVLAALCLYSLLGSRLTGYKTVDHQRATMLINRENALLVDVRSVDAYRKGHVAGARHIPASQIEKSQTSSLEKEKARPIIVTCENGTAAGRVCSHLLKQGHTAVYALKGGMAAWRDAGLPVTRK